MIEHSQRERETMKRCPSLLPFIIIKGRVLFPYWGFETFESHPNLFPSSQKHSSVVCGKNHSPAQSSLRLAGVSRRRRQGLDGDGKFHLASIVRAGPRQQRGLLGAEGVRIPLSSVEGCPLGSAGHTRLCLRIVFLHRTPAHPLLHGGRPRCRQHAGRTGDAAWPWTSTFSGVSIICCCCHGPPSLHSAPAGGEGGRHHGATPALAVPAPAQLHPAVLSRAGLQHGAGMEGQRLGEFLRCPWGFPSAENPQALHLQPLSARC